MPVSQRSLAWACCLRDALLVSAPVEVIAFSLFCRGHWLKPVPVDVASLNLFQLRYLSDSDLLRPVPTEVYGLGLLSPLRLLLWRLLSQACS